MRFAITISSLLLFTFFLTALPGCSSSQEPGPALQETSNPSNVVSTDARVNEILERSCYSCHSTGGSAPWYAAVSPTYLAANSARNVLNFSDWQSYDGDKRAGELKSIAQSVESGSMPPGDYTALNHTARLSDDDKQVLLAWVSGAAPAH